jgi:hypothetical protein
MDVEVRDAVEDDAETLGAIVDLPADALRNVVHDRTVRLAVDSPGDSGPNIDIDADHDADESIRGFVAFDVMDGTVHVTQLGGDTDVTEQLLAEPVRFAVREGFDVVSVVPDSDTDAAAAAEAAGFSAAGPGPRFDGESTTRYRFDPDE